jgi:hypothetical protein
VPGRARDDEGDPFGQRPQQPVDPLVWRHAPDEGDAAPVRGPIGMEAIRVGAAVDDRGLVRRRSKRLGGEARHGEEVIEHLRQETEPPPSSESVIRYGERRPPRGGGDRRNPSRGGAHLVNVHDVGIGCGADRSPRDRMRGVPPQVQRRANHDDLEPAWIPSDL